MPAARPIVLTIAGSDSGGGAGIQADLKTFAAFGCYGTSVVAAVTAQNTLGIRSIHIIPGDILAGQLQAIADDLPPVACKTGMLGTAVRVEIAANAIASNNWNNYVLDPVMVATSGIPLAEDDVCQAMQESLLPLTVCVTPNLDEAEALTGLVVRDPDAMIQAGQALLAMGAGAALVKGGHLASDILIDVLVTADRVERFARSRIVTRSTHGTGCTLSAAIVAGLAHGKSLSESVKQAIDYVQQAIKSAPGLGAGNGPLWHGREK